ncbi:MAG: hypothetical protein KAS53_00970 [Candidatus Cloacimonetes bacterium]|nr:hypothetical protein [Candidatus Cloacimonadota bacterium]
MNKSILIILLLIIISSTLIASISDSEILNTKSFLHPHISLTCGIQLGLGSSRITLKYYNNKMIYAVRYTDYNTFYIGTRPYREGITTSHEELSITINKVLYSPYANIQCSLGSGLLYRMRNVRDERISYENWTEKEIQDIGLPIELNLETFLIPTHFVINFGYKAIIYKEEFYQGLIIDIGFWFGERGKTK